MELEDMVKNAQLYFSEVIAEDFQLIRNRVAEMELYHLLKDQESVTVHMAIEYLYLKSAEKSKPQTFMDSYARIAFITETKIRMMQLDYNLYKKWMELESEGEAAES